MTASPGRPGRLAAWQAIGLLFALIAIVRVGMVLAFAPSIPFVDEWPGVILGMAKPLRHGQFDPAFLLASHNGHPLLWTKLISLAFLWADNVQFDNLPVCVFNQLVYALGSATLAWSAATRLGDERGWFLLAATLVIVLPFDWENITMGWGNPYQIMSFFSIGLIAACVCAPATALATLAIALLAGAAALSMASGVVAPLIGAAILMWRARLGEISRGRAAIIGAILVAWAALSVALGRTTHVTGQDAAWGSVHLFELALLVVCWLPAWLHFKRYLEGERTRFDLVILCVALWAFVQIVAMILERPRYFRLWLPISRYMEIISIGMFAVLASLCRLAESRRGLAFALPAKFVRASLVVVSIGVVLLGPLALDWQLRWAGFHRDQARVIRAYLQTGDAQVLADAPETSLAYPARDVLKAMLDDPDTRPVIAKGLDRSLGSR